MMQSLFWTIAAALAKLCETLVSRLPRRLVDGSAVLLGLFLWYVLRLRRRVVLGNLRIAYPEWTRATHRRIGRASMISFARTCFEFLDAKRVFGSCQIECTGEHILDEAVARGSGVYILCCHLGNWELMCQYGTHRFKPTHVVVKPIGKMALAETVAAMRGERGMTVIARDSDRQATVSIFRALRAGDLVGFMADQRRKRGHVAPFFGRSCHTNTSLLQLWLRNKAPIIPVSMVRTGFDRFRFVVWPEFIPPADLSGPLFFEESARAMNAVLERMVDTRPEQYFWMHRRWKGFEGRESRPPVS